MLSHRLSGVRMRSRRSRNTVRFCPGFTDTESLTVEDIRDNFDQIRDLDGYAVPANLTEELQLTLKALGG